MNNCQNIINKETNEGCWKVEIICESCEEKKHIDFAECPFNGDVQKCLNYLLECNKNGISWENALRFKKMYEEYCKMNEELEEGNAKDTKLKKLPTKN